MLWLVLLPLGKASGGQRLCDWTMRVVLLYADGLCDDWLPWLVTVSCCSCGNAEELPQEEGRMTVRLQS